MKLSKQMAVGLVSLLLLLDNIAKAEEKILAAPSQAKANEVICQDYITVDEESRSPEGGCHVLSSFYERCGDQYKSTYRSIPAATIEQIRQAAIASRAKTTPNLSDFGITRQSVINNQDVMVKSVYEDYGGKTTKPDASFATLPDKLKPLFEYDTVAKNALNEITGAVNSAYECVRVTLPGTPRIVLFSRRGHSSMLPWTVQCGESKWLTYDRSLPPQLAKLTSPYKAQSLAGDRPEMKFEGYRGLGKNATVFWPDGFFKRYSVWCKNAVQSYDSVVAAQNLPGWDVASKSLKIDDALSFNDGSLMIEVSSLDAGRTVTRARWFADGSKSKKTSVAPDWREFLSWYEKLQQAAQNTRWLDQWRKADKNRSLMAMNTNQMKISSWASEELDRTWTDLGLSGKPQYELRMIQPDRHYRLVYIGEPYTLSLVSDSGNGSRRRLELPKIMRPAVPESALKDYNSSATEIRKCQLALINQDGKTVKKTEAPADYAHYGNLPPRSAEDKPYDYRWPVDFSAGEDILYLDQKFDDNEIQSANLNPFQNLHEGLIDKSGKIIIKPQWKTIAAISSGIVPVENDSKKWGLIKTSGDVLVKAELEDAGNFYEGLAAIKNDGKWGFIDTSGTVVIPTIYQSATRFSEGLAAVKSDTRFGYIDKTGKFIIPPQFCRARHFRDGLAYVQIDGKVAYVDHSGKPIGGKYYDWLGRFADDRAVFKSDKKFGYIDKTGAEVIPAKFTRAESFRDEVAKVIDGDTEKAINTSGKFVEMPVSHSDFWDGPITEGLRRARQDCKLGWKYGFTDIYGKFVIEPQYDEIGMFDNGLCPVKIRDNWGVINKTGHLVISDRFEELDRQFAENRIAFREGKKWGLLDEKGNVILKPQFTVIYPFSNGLAVVQDGMKYGYIDLHGNMVIAPQFDSADQFGSNGFAVVRMRKDPDVGGEFP